MTGLLMAGGVAPRRAAARPEPPAPPFLLGVASGEPTHHSVVLWTRLATAPLDGRGMPPFPIWVDWEVATEARLRHVVCRGTALARPENAHSVCVEVDGLAPDRWYWYRFRAGEASPIGRTRTFPTPGSRPSRLRFAFVSCQHWESGFYTAYEHLAQEDLDLVVHLGDYIYEDGVSAGPPAVRQHNSAEITTLADYRNRHALYKTDTNLQAAHAMFPWIVTWDDHEVENNSAAATSEDNDIPGRAPVSPEAFLQRRANAYRAYFEHMPLSPSLRPQGPNLRLYRQLSYGRLAQFHVLDTRQFRSNQPCGGALDQIPPPGDDLALACGGELDPEATLLGGAQKAWLRGSLQRWHARWNVLAQQVMMARVNFAPTLPAPLLNMDAWDGAAAARNRLLGFVRDARIGNVVVLTGDIHSSWVTDLKADFADGASPVVATEFVGTSISSDFPPEFIAAIGAALAHPANATSSSSTVSFAATCAARWTPAAGAPTIGRWPPFLRRRRR